MNQNNNTSTRPGERFSLLALARSYRRWWPLIILVTALGTLAGGLWVYRTPIKNEICATLLITDTSKDTDLMNVSGMSSIFGSNIDLDNQVEKMKSHDLLKGLVKDYELNIANTYNKNFIKREKKFLNDLPLKFVASESICDTLTTTLVFKVKVGDDGLLSVKGRDGRRRVIVDQKGLSLPATFKTRYGEFTVMKTDKFDQYAAADGLPMKMTFTVSNYDFAAEELSKQIMPTIPNKKADIIELSYICPNRSFGKTFLADFIERYNKMGIDVDVEKARRVNEYLEHRIAEVHAAVTGKEAQAEAFARSHNMVIPEKDGAVDYGISAELKKNIILAQSEIEKLNLIKSLLNDSKESPSMLPVPAENQQIAQLVANYNAMVQRKIALEVDAKPSNRLLQSVVTQIDAIRDNILVSIDKAVDNARSVLSSVKRQKGGLDAGVQNQTTVTREYYDLMRDHEITNAIYLLLIKEQEHNFMKMNNTLPTGVVVSAPHVMKKKPGLPPEAIVFIVFCISFALVPAALYVWSLVDDRITDAAAVRRIAANADILGSLPALSRKQKSQGGGVLASLSTDYRDRIDEVRVATQFATRAVASPVILLSAARPGAGRSSVAISLAVGYAAAGRRALLVELDIAGRSLADTLGLSSAPGLVDLIADPSLPLSAVARQASTAGFDVVVAGNINTTPLSLLAAPELADIIAAMRRAYDVVILDGPAASSAKELEIVAPLSDLTVNVVRASFTTYSEVRQVEASTPDAAPIVVVNAVSRPGLLTLWK